jgi:myo-inositol-1-phosphate synthase
MKHNPEQCTGRLGVLLPGLGAVATTFIAGIYAIRRNLAQPVGSYTQMATIRLGKRTDNRLPKITDFVPLAALDSLVFGGWDVYEDSVYEAAMKAGVLESSLLNELKDELSDIKPMPAVFDREYVRRLDGSNVKKGDSKMDLAMMLMKDIEEFRQMNSCDRLVMIWCGSTEIYMKEDEVHLNIDAFEKGLKENHPSIAPSMMYAYAAIKMGIPYANGAPNLSADIPALVQLAKETGTPIAGKDFKTGQTLMKTIIAPGLKARLLGVNGWFSTNILGNRDGEVLDDPDNFKTKEVSKLSVLETILEPDLHSHLYDNLYHKIRINYYPPRKDNKESWDNIDIFGWLGYGMQIKINFLCRDSILAAPIVLDLALFLDLAKRADMSGIQEWLSFYFKSPQTMADLKPQHDLFRQSMKMENTLRYIQSEDLITHLGLDYYDEMWGE